MESPPPLPDSDDPFELLGVDPECSERDLKRAYARRIRIYRPDRHPEQFRRVRRAFEQAQAELAWDETEFEASEESEAPDHDPDVEDPEFPPLELADVFEERDLERARERLEHRTQSDPESARPYALRFLLEEAAGASFEEAAHHLHRGLERGTPVSEWLLSVLPPPDIEQFSLGPGCAWEVLQRQSDRDTAVLLFEVRCQVRLCAGDAAAVLEEITSRAFRRAAERHDGLRQLGLRIACALVWDHAQDAEDLHAFYAAPQPEEEDWIEEGYHDRVRLRDSWLRWAAESAGAEPLPTYLRLCHTVPDPDLRRLGAARLPWPKMFAALDRMQRINVELAYFLDFALDAAALAGDDMESEADPRTMTRRQKAALVQFRDTTEKVLNKSWANRVLEIGMGVAVFALILLFRKLGLWAGIIGVVVAFVGLGWAVVSTDARMYKRYVRDRILPLVAEHGIAPTRIVAWIKKNTKDSESLNRLDDEITEDRSLDLVYRLRRFFGA